MSLYRGKGKIKKQISSEVVQNSPQGLERYILFGPKSYNRLSQIIELLKNCVWWNISGFQQLARLSKPSIFISLKAGHHEFLFENQKMCDCCSKFNSFRFQTRVCLHGSLLFTASECRYRMI